MVSVGEALFKSNGQGRLLISPGASHQAGYFPSLLIGQALGSVFPKPPWASIYIDQIQSSQTYPSTRPYYLDADYNLAL
jgi:hypothetical protein